MKKLIQTLLLLFISTCVFHANSQTALMSPVYPGEQKITHVKAFESRYLNGKVYLHITVNGNTETKIVAVERSLDAKNFEVIGYIKIYGTPYLVDLAYYFTDESPVAANLFYRLSDYSVNNEPAYSETKNIIPMDENKVIPVLLAFESICPETDLEVAK